jgi:hypothetical protein
MALLLDHLKVFSILLISVGNERFRRRIVMLLEAPPAGGMGLSCNGVVGEYYACLSISPFINSESF